MNLFRTGGLLVLVAGVSGWASGPSRAGVARPCVRFPTQVHNLRTAAARTDVKLSLFDPANALLAEATGQGFDPVHTIGIILATLGIVGGSVLFYLMNVVFPERRL